MRTLILMFCLALLGSGCTSIHKKPDGTIEYAGSWFTSDDADDHESTSGTIGIAHHAIENEVPTTVRKDDDGNFSVSVMPGYGGIVGYNNPYVPQFSHSEISSYNMTMLRQAQRAAASRGMPIAPPSGEEDGDESADVTGALKTLGAKVDAVGKKVDVVASDVKGTKKVSAAVLKKIATSLDAEKK